MADLPASVGYMTVTGRLVLGYADSTDAGSRPDMAPGVGTVTFTQDIASTFPLVSIPDELMIASAAIKCALDANGEIVPPADGNESAPSSIPGVNLIAPLQPGILSITDWTWTATFTPAAGQKWKAFSRTFTGAPGDVLNIATLIPVPASPGTELALWQATVTTATTARDQAVAAAASVRPVEFEDDFTGKSGPLTVADTGQTYTTTETTQGELSIIDGKLTNTATTGTQAGYGQVQLSQNVARIGAEFEFGPGGVGGGINIAIWKTSIASWPTIPDSPLHITVTPVNYGISVFTGGVYSDVVAPRPFMSQLAQDGTIYEVEAIIEPNGDVYVFRPDGLVDGPFNYPEALSNAGRFTNHEIYNNDAATETKGGFARIWADIRGTA